MTKEAFYFSHDSNARQDEKIIALRMRLGWEGYGIYWAIVEKLREASEYKLSTDYNVISFDLRIDSKVIKAIVEDFELFVFSEDGKLFWSDRMMRNMEQKEEKSKKARDSANKRWLKSDSFNDGNANVMRTHNEGNAIKESKVNESKVNIIPPISPNGDDGDNPPVWKKDFNTYLNEIREAFKTLKSDNVWIAQQEKFNPGVDILKSIEKSCVNYWATEAGWKKKKGSKIKQIDWKSTFANAVTQSMNKVYKERFPEKQQVRQMTEPLEPAI